MGIWVCKLREGYWEDGMWALLLGRSVGDLGWNPKCYALNVWDVYRITQGRGPCIGHEGIREARGCGQGHRIN